MKVLKIIGVFFCGLMTLAGGMAVFSQPSSESVGSNLFVTIIFLICTVLLVRSLKGEGQKKRESADDYYKKKVEEADRYYSEKTGSANLYYSQKKTEGDQYFLEKKKEADNYSNDLKAEVSELKSQIDTFSSEAMVKSVQVGDYDNLRSDEIKNRLTMLRGDLDEAVKIGSAVTIIGAFDSKREANTQTKQILRCFNAECANIIGSVTVKNVDSSRSKIQRSFDMLNKIFESDGVQISKSYLASKLEELSLVYTYMVKEEEEKEQRRAIREQMVEEEKVRREIERAKQKIEKEETQFSNEVKKLMSYMQKAKDDVEKQLYIDKIQELEEKLKALQADKDNVLEREQNTRAGFVYIISNIGSFGEQVFKIGMTRRLEPMDRIAELSSASVPFPFDVHAMIFSEDAPGLETVLHQHFDSERVNKVNPRKEFFKVDLDEIKKVVLENHNATVKFVDIPDATEYRETLRMEESEKEAG